MMAFSGVRQFVAHIGQELRLVLACDLEFPAFLLISSNSRTFSIAIAA